MSHRRAKRERRKNKSRGPSRKPEVVRPIFVDDHDPIFGDPIVEKALKQVLRRRGGNLYFEVSHFIVHRPINHSAF